MDQIKSKSQSRNNVRNLITKKKQNKNNKNKKQTGNKVMNKKSIRLFITYMRLLIVMTLKIKYTYFRNICF